MSNYSHCALSPTEAEALGLHEAIKFAIDNNNMSPIVFDSYYKIIDDSINYSLVPQN